MTELFACASLSLCTVSMRIGVGDVGLLSTNVAAHFLWIWKWFGLSYWQSWCLLSYVQANKTCDESAANLVSISLVDVQISGHDFELVLDEAEEYHQKKAKMERRPPTTKKKKNGIGRSRKNKIAKIKQKPLKNYLIQPDENEVRSNYTVKTFTFIIMCSYTYLYFAFSLSWLYDPSQ